MAFYELFPGLKFCSVERSNDLFHNDKPNDLAIENFKFVKESPIWITMELGEEGIREK